MKSDSSSEIIKKDFIDEAIEQISICEDSFLDLETNPSQKTEILNKIFRLFHTVKGSGLAAGFEDLSAFAHIVESLISKLQKNEITLNDHTIEVLLKSNDLIRDYLTNYGDHPIFQEDQALENELWDLMGGEAAKEELGKQRSDDENLPGFGFFHDNDSELEEITVPSDHKDEPEDEVLKNNASVLKKYTYNFLICDDDQSLCEVIKEALEDKTNCLVITAKNGNIATNIIKENKLNYFDAILTDLKMPGMDGIELVKTLRKMGCPTPLIFTSGFARESDLRDFFKFGVRSFVSKPFKIELLVHEIIKAGNYKKQLEVTEELASLNFAAYVNITKFMKDLEDQIPAELKNLELETKKQIQNMSKLFNRLKDLI